MKSELLLFITGWASPAYLLQDLAEKISHKLNANYKIVTADQIVLNPETFWRTFSKEHQALSISVVAWSMGALLALEADIKKYLSFKNIFVISSCAKMTEDSTYPGVSSSQLRAMKQQLSKNKNKLIKDFWSQALSEQDFQTYYEGLQDYADSQDFTCLLAGLEYLEKTDLRDELPDLQISDKVSIIHGSNDKIMPIALGYYLKNISGADFIEIPGASHLPFIQDQEAVVNFIVNHATNYSHRFSQHAENYDKWAIAQKQIAQHLLQIILKYPNPPKTILDIGCGSGYMTELLLKNLPQIQMTAIDSACGMIRYCKQHLASYKNLDFETIDARHYNQKQFDLLTSNCALQWISDLKQFFSDKQNNLNSAGTFTFATLVHPTLLTLQQAYKSVSNKNLPGIQMKDSEEYTKALLAADFKIIYQEEKEFSVEYTNTYSLLKSLKMIGAVPEKNSYLPLALADIKKLCKEHDKLTGAGTVIKVRYQALFIIAGKNE